MTEFECPDCGKVLYSEEALQQHRQAKHEKQEQKREKGKSRRNLYIAGTIIVLAVIGIVLAAGIKPPAYTPKTEPAEKFLGNGSANVTLTEFSNYECPFCTSFDKNTEPQIIQAYVDTGKVKLVFKNFPLPSHANSEKAAEAAECAYDIGGSDAFWQLHKKMFANSINYKLNIKIWLLFLL